MSRLRAVGARHPGGLLLRVGECAPLMLVGEQPGDREDVAGEPFVGPAGRVLVDALDAVGVPRSDVYMTNAVKHFRHEQRGKRRIHQKPELRHLIACHPWLEAELDVVEPALVVALGATAGRAVLGRPVKIGGGARQDPRRAAPPADDDHHTSVRPAPTPRQRWVGRGLRGVRLGPRGGGGRAALTPCPGPS